VGGSAHAGHFLLAWDVILDMRKDRVVVCVSLFKFFDEGGSVRGVFFPCHTY